jgi:hypothetical protein
MAAFSVNPRPTIVKDRKGLREVVIEGSNTGSIVYALIAGHQSPLRYSRLLHLNQGESCDTCSDETSERRCGKKILAGLGVKRVTKKGETVKHAGP